MSRSRQLVAISFSDIVNYTSIMGEDEEKAFKILKENGQLQKPLIEHYEGKWIKDIGDAILAIFPTVMGAVQCATLIIKGCYKIEGLALRIGIHLAEVVLENEDVYGDGVNIASRLQHLAPVNGIYISDAVYHNISNKREFNTKFIKEERLKNVKEKIPIYQVIVEYPRLNNNTDESNNSANKLANKKTFLPENIFDFEQAEHYKEERTLAYTEKKSSSQERMDTLESIKSISKEHDLFFKEFIGSYKLFLGARKENSRYDYIYENRLEIYENGNIEIINPFNRQTYIGFALIKNENCLQILSFDFNERLIEGMGTVLSFKINLYGRRSELFPGLGLTFDADSKPIAVQALLSTDIANTKKTERIKEYFDSFVSNLRMNCPETIEVEKLVNKFLHSIK